MCSDGQKIVAVKRRLLLSQVDYILEQTKQRLLDNLLELDKNFRI